MLFKIDVANLTSSIHVGGQLWASMEIKASRKETGFSMVRLQIYHRLFGALSWLLIPFVISEFKYGKAPILIATDVASRGLGQYLPT